MTSVRPCGWWGNDKLAFAHVNATYEAQSSVGHTLVLLVLRKPSTTWQLLVASRDPISNGQFWEQAALRTAPLSNGASASLPLPATLLSPGEGLNPRPSDGQRFGTFEWQSSPSADVVAEIVEFAYEDDARLFFGPRVTPEARRQISAGQLWTTRSTWNWRVWSINRAGDVAFSGAWAFPN